MLVVFFFFFCLTSLNRNILMVAKIKSVSGLERDPVHNGCHTAFSLADEWMDGFVYFITSAGGQMVKQMQKSYRAYGTLSEVFCWHKKEYWWVIIKIVLLKYYHKKKFASPRYTSWIFIKTSSCQYPLTVGCLLYFVMNSHGPHKLSGIADVLKSSPEGLNPLHCVPKNGL